MFTEEFLENLTEEMRHQPATLFQILKLAQEDEQLWSRITSELDPENPHVASDYLASLLEIYEAVGEDDSAVLTAYDVLHVALHNALSCVDAPQKLSPLADMIPCTRGWFKTVRREDGYYLVFMDQTCPFAAKTKTGSQR